MTNAKSRYVRVADRLIDENYECPKDGTLHVEVARDGDQFYVKRLYQKYGWLPRRNRMTFQELVATFPHWIVKLHEGGLR